MSIQERIMNSIVERLAKSQARHEAEEQAVRDINKIEDVSTSLRNVLDELSTSPEFVRMFRDEHMKIELANMSPPKEPEGDYLQGILSAVMKYEQNGRTYIRAIVSTFPDVNDIFEFNSYAIVFNKTEEDIMECRLHIIEGEMMGYEGLRDESYFIRITETVELGSDIGPESPMPESLRETMGRLIQANVNQYPARGI